MKTKMWLGICSSNRPLHLHIFFSAGTCDSYCFEEIFCVICRCSLSNHFVSVVQGVVRMKYLPSFISIYVCMCVCVCTTSVNWNIF
jgi:hypothetical protein